MAILINVYHNDDMIHSYDHEDTYEDAVDVMEEYNEKYDVLYDVSQLMFEVEHDDLSTKGDKFRYTSIDSVIELIEEANNSVEFTEILEYFITDLGYPLGALDTMKVKDAIVFNGTVEDAAENAVRENGDLPDHYDQFFNYHAYGDSMISDGFWAELDGYVILNADNL